MKEDKIEIPLQEIYRFNRGFQEPKSAFIIKSLVGGIVAEKEKIGSTNWHKIIVFLTGHPITIYYLREDERDKELEQLETFLTQ